MLNILCYAKHPQEQKNNINIIQKNNHQKKLWFEVVAAAVVG